MSEKTMTPQEGQEPSVLDLLLGSDLPRMDKDLPTAQFTVPRLNELAGRPVTFTLRALPYGRVRDLQRLREDADVHILLAGCVAPDLKDPRLQERFGGPTPADAVKHMLLPGEIADLAGEVERLTGYRRVTIEEVKNA